MLSPAACLPPWQPQPEECIIVSFPGKWVGLAVRMERPKTISRDFFFSDPFVGRWKLLCWRAELLDAFAKGVVPGAPHLPPCLVTDAGDYTLAEWPAKRAR